jgi:hypothetical protein
MPPGLQTLLDKGMAIYPEERYQTVEAFLTQLLPLLEPSSPVVSSTDGLQPILAHPIGVQRVGAGSPALKRLILACAAVLLLAGGGMFWMLTNRTPIMEPQTLKTAAPPAPLSPDTARQAIAAALRSVPCSFVTGDDQPDGSSTLRGVVGRGQNESALHSAIQNAAPNGTIEWQVAPADGPYCAVLDTVRPYAQPFGGGGNALTIALRTGVSTWSLTNLLCRGRPCPTSPGRCSSTISPATAASSICMMRLAPCAMRLCPRSFSASRTRRASEGGRWTGRSAPDLIVGIASSVPLFSTARPEEDKPDAYLRDLRVAASQAILDGNRISAAVLLLHTSPKH